MIDPIHVHVCFLFWVYVCLLYTGGRYLNCDITDLFACTRLSSRARERQLLDSPGHHACKRSFRRSGDCSFQRLYLGCGRNTG